MRIAPAVALALAVFLAACHPGPVVNTEPNKVGGTIAGIVKTADSAVAVPGRKVSVIDSTGVPRLSASPSWVWRPTISSS